MKFTVKNEFKSGYRTFEVGNSHDSSKMPDITEEDVQRWYRAGFVDIEGKEPGPEPNPQRVELVVHKATNGQNIKEPS